MYLIEAISRDVRHACRLLIRRPMFAGVAIATLAIGLATITLAVAAINALFVKGPDGQDVPGAGWVNFTADRVDVPGGASLREYEALARDVPSLDIAANSRTTLSYRGPEGAEVLWALIVSPNYFDLLGVHAKQGRLFSAVRESSPCVIVSERFWRERLHAAPLTGLTVSLNGLDVPVVGVLPDGHRGPGGFYDPSAWIRLADSEALRLPLNVRAPESRQLGLLGRLRSDATQVRAQHELDRAGQELAREWPDTNTGRGASFTLFADGEPQMRELAPVAVMAMLMVGLVLLIAIFNLAGLLLARAVDREREMSLRAALGASRVQIIRQLVVESLVIAVLGGGVALVISWWSENLLATFALPTPIPQRLDVTPDRVVVAFVAGALVLCGVISGLIPARFATRLGAGAALNSAMLHTQRATKLRATVVALQIAGATLLLTAAAVFLQNTLRAGSANVGFEPERVVLLELNAAQYGHTAAGARQLLALVGERLRSLPAVRDVSAADQIPFYVGFPTRVEVSVDGRSCASEQCPMAGSYHVAPQYFRTLDIPIRRGREFEGPGDAQAVVISETMARQFSSSGDLLGQWISLNSVRMQVIGIAADVLHRGLRERPEPYVYLPLDDDAFARSVTLLARTTSDPQPLLAAAREQVHAVDPDLPIGSLQTMKQRLEDRARRNEGTIARFFTVIGALALFLSAVGLAGTVSYSVGQRTREFGIRSAIGAAPSDLRGLVLRDGVTLVVPGVAAGLVAGIGVVRIIGGTMPSVDVSSPIPYVLVGIFQLSFAVALSAFPGRKAAQANPLAALRYE